MSCELENLIELDKQRLARSGWALKELMLRDPRERATSDRGGRMEYFLKKLPLILELIERGFGYAKIVEMINKDGMPMSHQYFKELMAKEKRRARG
jgi:hypothetical protein